MVPLSERKVASKNVPRVRWMPAAETPRPTENSGPHCGVSADNRSRWRVYPGVLALAMLCAVTSMAR